MQVRPQVFDNPESLGRTAASEIADAITASSGRPFLLGCPGGRSPSSTYAALADLAEERELDLSRVVIVMMDDYVVETPLGALARENPKAAHSCERFARDMILGPLNAVVGAAHCIPEENLWFPELAAPEEYDEKIQAAGGVDLFILASGASDGHIAFNPPGSPISSKTRVVELPESTRRDNLATFPTFLGKLDNVPRYGITVGIDTIRSHSKSVLLLCHGEDKGMAVRCLASAVGYQMEWPATIFTECRNPRFFIDRTAEHAANSQYL